MPEISSATKEVLAAIKEVCWDWASMEQASPQDIAAAAIRAAADQCTDGVAHLELYAIAADLESQ